MRKISLVVFIIFTIFISNSNSLNSRSSNLISNSILFNALNQGCSLITGEIKSVNKFKHQKYNSIFYNYNIKVLDIIIKGDLDEQKIQDSNIIIFAGASFGNKLKIGRKYIMFIAKYIEYDYTWCNQNDVIDLSVSNKNFKAQDCLMKLQRT